MAAARPPTRFVSYARVSTDKQGRSGLGLEAQREAVASRVAQAGGRLVAEFTEVESGRRRDRPQLAAALAAARLHLAALEVARLDQLARDSRFLHEIRGGSGEAGVVFCDLPQIPSGPVGQFMIQIMASIAELERRLTSERTAAALAAAKALGVRLGNPALPAGTAATAHAARAVNMQRAQQRARDLVPQIDDLRRSGVTSMRGIARALEERGIPTPSGAGRWQANLVQRALELGRAA